MGTTDFTSHSSEDDEYMRLILVHSNGNHWVLLMTIGDKFYYYNSLSNGGLTSEHKKIAWYYQMLRNR